MYATDSASMLAKAKNMLIAASLNQPLNPFRRAWGLQTNGDLWEQAWGAVTTRGDGNQELRKVKGHATQEDIEQVRSTPEDKRGNDASDELADEGFCFHQLGGANQACKMAGRKA